MIRHGCRHAVEAAAARYGVRLDDADFTAMVDSIIAALLGETSPAVMLCRQSAGREIWAVRVPEGPAVRVAYSPPHAQIVTVLPPRFRLPHRFSAAPTAAQ